MFTRLLVHVEGHTEEKFVNEVLSHELYKFGYGLVRGRLLGTSRLRSKRGGIISWHRVRRDILRHLKEDKQSVSTTMVDYYGLPQCGDGAWPGRAESNFLPHAQRADTIEELMLKDIRESMGPKFDTRRFIPFVMMHEFEALLFSACHLFRQRSNSLNWELCFGQFEMLSKPRKK